MLRKKILLSLVVAVLALLLGEGGYRGWLRARGRAYSAENARGRIVALLEYARNYSGEAEGEPRDRAFQVEDTRDVLHPFHAFDYSGGQNRVQDDLKRLREEPEAFSVMILGGSVAAWFGTSCRPALRAILERDPRVAGRPIVFLNYGQPSFKQPQQVTRLAYLLALGLVPDVVINLDGFNELAIGNSNAAAGAHPLFPSRNKWLTLTVEGRRDPDHLLRIARVRAVREELVRASEVAVDSPSLHSALLGRRTLARLERLRAEMASGTQALVEELHGQKIPRHLLGPRFRGDERQAIAESARGWFDCSRMIQALCESYSITYLHVLQPALHADKVKPLRPEEVADANVHPTWVHGVEWGYPLLREGGKRLARSGVHFLDASTVFAGVEERTYSDACHLLPLGGKLLARAVGKALIEYLPE